MKANDNTSNTLMNSYNSLEINRNHSQPILINSMNMHSNLKMSKNFSLGSLGEATININCLNPDLLEQSLDIKGKSVGQLRKVI